MRSWFAVPSALMTGALAALLLAAQPSPAQAPAAVPVHLGLIRTLFRDAPEPLIQVMSRPFKSLMANEAGIIADVTVTHDPDDLALKMKQGKIQIGVFNGFEFAWARLKNPELKPLMIAVNQQPFVRSVLVVRVDDQAVNLGDMRDQILAVPKLAREYNHLFVERRCVVPGHPPKELFGKVTRPTTASNALDDLAEKLVQAALVDDIELEAFRKAYPKTAARLRVLVESERFPCAVIAYQPGTLTTETVARLRDGMIAAKTTARGKKLLDVCRITAFEAVPEDYEQNLASILKAYPPLGK